MRRSVYRAGFRATSRAIDSYKRDQRKRENTLKKEKRIAKSNLELAEFDKYIKNKIVFETNRILEFDWKSCIEEKAPEKPIYLNKFEDKAVTSLEDYVPSFFDKLFFQGKKKIRKLRDEVNKAIEIDKSNFSYELKEWQNKIKKIKVLKTIGNTVISEDYDQMGLVMDYLLNSVGKDPILEWIFDIDFTVSSKKDCKLSYVIDDSCFPKHYYVVTKTGVFSERKLTKTAYYEFFKEYVHTSVNFLSLLILMNLPIKNLSIDVYSLKDEYEGDYKKIGVYEINSTIIELYNNSNNTCSDNILYFDYIENFKKTKGFYEIM